MKIYYFHALKALWDGQGKIKMHYGMSRVKAAIRERSINKTYQQLEGLLVFYIASSSIMHKQIF